MKYLAFDSNYFCWRAFHTPASKLSYNNSDTGVINSFLTQILIHSRYFGLKFPIFFWDSKKKFRQQIYSGYKVRDHQEMTEEEQEARKQLFVQMNDLRENVLPLIGFQNNHIQTGLEADDLIARFVMDNPNQTVVLTNDDDLLQLADYCTWYSPSRKTTFNGKQFRKVYGIDPEQWKDVKAIAGCNSDKVPGVSGIGETFAIQFLKNEMKPGSIRYNKIVSPKGKWLKKRNEVLVSLPYPGTKKIELKESCFNPEGFLAVCDLYGMSEMAGRVGEWENHFRR